MLRRMLTISVFVMCCHLLSGVPATGKKLLEKAHSLKNSRHYAIARTQYFELAKKKSQPEPVRREAAYWMGFCSIMDKSYTRAISDYKWFLSAFNNGKDLRFVPDAMFVLGRTLEMEGEPKEAAHYYQECLKLEIKGGNPFTGKARAGLARIKEMIDYREGLERRGVIAKDDPASATARLRQDPLTKEPLTSSQYKRIREFTRRMSDKKPLNEAMSVLKPEDVELPMIKQFLQTVKNLETEKKSATPKKIQKKLKK